MTVGTYSTYTGRNEWPAKFASVGNLSCAPSNKLHSDSEGRALWTLVSDRKVVIDREVGQVGLQKLGWVGSRRRASIER